MKPLKPTRFARLVAESSVPAALARLVEARGADYIAARNPTTGLYAVRVPLPNEGIAWMRVNDAGECVVVESISQTIQPAAMGWPVAA